MPKVMYVYSRGGAERGEWTGSSWACRMEGCTGRRLEVKWSNGKCTRPCTKGMFVREDGNWQISGEDVNSSEAQAFEKVTAETQPPAEVAKKRFVVVPSPLKRNQWAVQDTLGELKGPGGRAEFEFHKGKKTAHESCARWNDRFTATAS